jgi:hypothetical protein
VDRYSPIVRAQFVDPYDDTHKCRVQRAVGLEIRHHEERSTFRRRTPETASSLSVSGGEPVPSPGKSSLTMGSRILETLGFEGEYLSEC